MPTGAAEVSDHRVPDHHLEVCAGSLTTFKKSRNKYILRLALKPVSAAIAMRTSSTLVELLNCVLLHNVVEYIFLCTMAIV